MSLLDKIANAIGGAAQGWLDQYNALISRAGTGPLMQVNNDGSLSGRLPDLAELLGLGIAAPMRAPAAAEEALSLASRASNLYNPVAKAPRTFAADYPTGAASDGAGRLTYDIDGRPLSVSARVVGRQNLDGGDVALSPAEAQSVGEGSVGASYSRVPASGLPRGEIARYRQRNNPDVGDLIHQILIRRDLSPTQYGRALQHETGHLIDEVAGQIPTAGLDRPLRQIYNTMNTGAERERNLTGPQHFGYKGADIPRELMVEAIRAYMADPNYLKTVAPAVAARIRAAINTHPVLSPHIQFNSAAPVGPLASPPQPAAPRYLGPLA